MAALGVSSARAAEVAAYRTREAKDYGVDPDRRREEWRARAQEFGLGREQIRGLCGPPREPRRRTQRKVGPAVCSKAPLAGLYSNSRTLGPLKKTSDNGIALGLSVR
jgi:hypothetical protein